MEGHQGIQRKSKRVRITEDTSFNCTGGIHTMHFCSWNRCALADPRLEMSLEQSEQRVCELSRVLAQSEEHLSQLQTLSQSQNTEIQQLRDVCTQLGGVREMNEVGACYTFYSPPFVAFTLIIWA